MPDLIGTKTVFEDCLFEGLRAPEAFLRWSSFIRCFLFEAEFTEANLEEADLTQSDLGRARLRKAVLKKAVLFRVNLKEAYLKEADLQEADLRHAILKQADLREANLSYADLRGVNLEGTDLRGANLTGANLVGVDLSTALLEGAILDGALVSIDSSIDSIFDELKRSLRVLVLQLNIFRLQLSAELGKVERLIIQGALITEPSILVLFLQTRRVIRRLNRWLRTRT
jgi:hypothetical protein